ncbi:hypothetical protein STEG23_027907, partial [Scotinomys teguina]
LNYNEVKTRSVDIENQAVTSQLNKDSNLDSGFVNLGALPHNGHVSIPNGIASGLISGHFLIGKLNQ